jgi:hypothetical protein
MFCSHYLEYQKPPFICFFIQTLPADNISQLVQYFFLFLDAFLYKTFSIQDHEIFVLIFKFLGSP